MQLSKHLFGLEHTNYILKYGNPHKAADKVNFKNAKMRLNKPRKIKNIGETER